MKQAFMYGIFRPDPGNDPVSVSQLYKSAAEARVRRDYLGFEYPLTQSGLIVCEVAVDSP